jgi:hypothetical protein
MKYIFTATKTEAQAIVEYFKLKKLSASPLIAYGNNSLHVIVTGIGKEKVLHTLAIFDTHYTLLEDDSLCNIGIAAAPKKFPIGSLCPIEKLFYKDECLHLPTKGEELLSVTQPQNKQLQTLVDMEAFFIAKHFMGKNLKIYKVVSDHFQPEVVTKEKTKQLLKEALKKL